MFYPSAIPSKGRSPVADAFPFDVFISYRQKEPEKSWVRQTLRPALGKTLKVFIDYEQFRLGEPVVQEMERAVIASAYTLAVVTPQYAASRFTEFENLISQHYGLEGSGHRLIIVMRDECELPLRLRYKLWLNMTTAEEVEENMPRLIEALTQKPGD